MIKFDGYFVWYGQVFVRYLTFFYQKLLMPIYKMKYVNPYPSTEGFTNIDKKVLLDNRLSLGARGILITLLSLSLENEFNSEDIEMPKDNIESDKIELLEELKKFEYLESVIN